MKQQNNFKKFQIKVDKITDMYYNDYSKWNIKTFKKVLTLWRRYVKMNTIKILGGINYDEWKNKTITRK